MNIKKNNKGFSLVEMIVTIAIIAILAGVSFSLLGHLKHANTEKTVQTLSMVLSKLQARTMSKTGKSYLYLYQIDGAYYVTVSTTDCNSFNSAVMKKDGNPLGSGMSIYGVDSSGAKTLIENNGFIKVAYRRNGAFDTSNTNYASINIVGNYSATIKLVTETGKYIVSLD